MTVSTEISREEYTGNGVTTDFDYRFRVFSADELVVTVADTTENIRTLVLNTDYTVTGAGSRNGGKVKLVSALANDWRISIERELPVTQETDVRNQGNFFPEVHEDAWDKLTMLIQQAFSNFGLALRKPSWLAKYYDAKGNRIANLADPVGQQDAATKGYVDGVASSNLSRALRVPEPIAQLPPASSRRNTFPAFDDTGAPTVMVPTSGSAADVLLQLAGSDKNLAPVDHVHIKNGPIVDFRRFLTVKDGSVNATQAVIDALNSGLNVQVSGDYILRVESAGIVAAMTSRFFGAPGTRPTILIDHTDVAQSQFTFNGGFNYFANFAFRYPNQKRSLATGESPVAYLPLLTGNGFSSEFINLDLGNTYRGLQFGDSSYSASRITIRDIIGAPIRRGVTLDRVLDIPKCDNWHFNYNYLDASNNTGYSYDLTLRQWIHDFADAFHLGRCDFGAFSRIFAFGYFNGIFLRTERYTGSANSVRFTDCDMDICVHPLRFQNWQNQVTVTNGKFTGNAKSTGGLIEKEPSVNLFQGTSEGGVIVLDSTEMNNYSSDAIQTAAHVKCIGSQFYGYGFDNGQRAAIATTTGTNPSMTILGTRVDGASGTQTRGFYGTTSTGTLTMGDSTTISGTTLDSFRWANGQVNTSNSTSLGGMPGRNNVSFISNVPKRFPVETMPTSGTFYRPGDIAVLTIPVKTNFAGQPNYVITGWTRLTTASTNSHVLNTDWVENRTYFNGVS